MKQAAITLINVYQVFFSFDSGILRFFAPGGACKFELSCSEYSKKAILNYGVLQGGLMGLKRVWRCR